MRRSRPNRCAGRSTATLAGQAQKETFVNEAHALADALLHLAIEGEAASPPGAPADGEAWLVGASAMGDWAGEDGKIACRQAGNWLFVAPRDGMRLLDRSTGQERRFYGIWRIAEEPLEPSGGSVVDAEARAVILQLIAALKVAGIYPESA
ncbi:MAG: DUF2793 domain-containing protein [Sphingomonadales bacterium]|nr:DUF2793 domain-containing protein [Sphingomonadales bacterium]